MQSSKHRRRVAWLSVILTLGVLAAACGDDDDDTAASDSGGGDSASGEVNVSGSSTVQPISVAAGEAYQEENADVTVNVDGPGTGDGFELFCNGETDISDASRPIEQEEIDACTENGIEYVELQIAYDGITVMTNPNNEAVECLSFADLYSLIGPEAEGFANWSDGTEIATALGSSTVLPDAELALTGPGTESGTYDSFIELAITPVAEERGLPEDQLETTRTDYDASPDDNVIIQNIEASDTSLGWVGFAFAEQAGDAVKELGVSEEPNGDLRHARRRDDRRRQLPAVPVALHLRQHGQRRGELRGERLRRLLPGEPGRVRRGHRLRAAARRPAQRHHSCLGRPLSR